jgi:hypothetical protein
LANSEPRIPTTPGNAADQAVLPGRKSEVTQYKQGQQRNKGHDAATEDDRIPEQGGQAAVAEDVSPPGGDVAGPVVPGSGSDVRSRRSSTAGIRKLAASRAIAVVAPSHEVTTATA